MKRLVLEYDEQAGRIDIINEEKLSAVEIDGIMHKAQALLDFTFEQNLIQAYLQRQATQPRIVVPGNGLGH